MSAKEIHGHSSTCTHEPTPTYRCWESMIRRVENEKVYNSVLYKGVEICDRWRLSYHDFLEEMGEKPSGMVLGRIDKKGNYTPDNCKWFSPKDQARSRSNTIKVLYQGEEWSLITLCEELEVPYSRTKQRIKRGWNIERALSIPSLSY